MEETIRSGFGRVLTGAVVASALVALVTVTVTSGAGDALLTSPWLALISVACWAFFWRPAVGVSDAGVRLVNVTRTVMIPWPAISDVDTRFALTLHTAYGRFSAWAAPAAGAGTALRSQMRMRRQDSAGRAMRKGDLEGTPSGDAAAMVRRRWERLRDAGFLDDPRLEHDRPPMTWHWNVLAAIVVLAGLCAATLVVA